MGIVYHVLDRQRNTRVALKAIHDLEADNLVRFKREFRLIQELQHPNLVSLDELIEHQGQWFFTMELVDGVDILAYVYEKDAEGEWLGFDEARLRQSIAQLCQGLFALHSVEKVHRDIKPENILVAADGRVVILDFGLVTNVDGGEQTTDIAAVGTYVYMAPEQGAGQSVTEKADWYSVGVVLYEALTGQTPFSGPGVKVLMKKQVQEPEPPQSLRPEVPDDLNELCIDLLRTEPEDRPAGREILRRLHVDIGAATRLSHFSTTRDDEPIFVGREAELYVLQNCFEQVLQRKAKTVLLEGESGVGKSRLVSEFAKQLLETHPDTLVFVGKCYEQETVPYKAFDGIVDQISRWLKKLSRSKVEGILPRNVALLTKTFPVLARVDSISEAPRRRSDVQDPLELRSRVFLAMRELFDRIAERNALVVAIDDLQWSDTDSLAMLSELTRPPERPPFLLIGAVRSSPDAKLPIDLSPIKDVESTSLRLEALSEEESRTLANHLLKFSPVLSEERMDSIVRESHGHPLFIDRLVQYLEGDSSELVRLEEALWDQISCLEDEQCQILELLSVVGVPISQGIAADAAGMDGNEFAKHIKVLRIARLVRTSGSQVVDSVELYHNRVQEAISANLSPEILAPMHRRLARAFENSERRDPELLTIHWEGAAELEKAAEYAVQAAQRASEAIAFDRAAKFYQRAISLLETPPYDLKIELGDALAKAGKGWEAAEIYRAVIPESSPVQALNLKVRIAEGLLTSGRFDEGIEGFQSVFSELGVTFPRSPRRAFVELIRLRAWVRIRGLGYKLRHPSEISEAELVRVDACWAAAKGLGGIDVIFGQLLSAQMLLLALETGDAYRIARSLAFEIANMAVERPRAIRAREKLIVDATRLAEESGEPHARGIVLFNRGLGHYIRGEWRKTVDFYTEAEVILRTECSGATWELSTITTTIMEVFVWFGAWAEIGRRAPRVIQEAIERGDLYTETFTRCGSSVFVALVADDVEQARREAEQALRRWSRQGFHAQHMTQLRYEVLTSLYVKDVKAAEQTLRESWGTLSRSLLLRVPLIRIIMYQLHAGCDLEGIRIDPENRAKRLRSARRFSRKLSRERNSWAHPIAGTIDAAIAAIEGDDQRAAGLLKQANEAFQACDMPGFAAMAQWHRGRILGGDIGVRLTRQAEKWMRGEGAKNPARLSAILLPGFPDTP